MGEGGATERPKTPGYRAGVFVLRFVSAVIAVWVLTELTTDLLDKASAPEPSAGSAIGTTTDDDETGDDGDEPRRRRSDPHLVHAGDPTVYDAHEDLERCTRTRRTLTASTRAPGLVDDIDRISNRVERLRDLDFERAVDARLVSRDEVGERYVRGYLRRYTEKEAARDERELTALGLLPEGTDLRALTAQMLGDGVAGFYNPRKDRLFSGSSGGVLTPFEEVVLAHELDHALVDQALRLPGTLSLDPMLGDVMLAHQALAEGDATLVMAKYAARRLPDDEFDSFMSRFSPGPVQAPTPVPYFLLRSGEFPYFEGMLFACAEWRAQGWDAVSRMYLRPPATSADVLFPFRYYEDNEAELPRAPSAPGRAWGPSRARSFGAFDLMVLLENAALVSNGETVPGTHVDSVRGWDGGVLHTWQRGDEVMLHLGLVDAGVETRNGRKRRLCGVVGRWVEEAFPGTRRARPRVAKAEAWRTDGDLVVLRCERSAVELAKGPSAKAVRAVLRG